MPFTIPTLADLVTQTAADIKSRLTNADALLRRSTIGVIGRVVAGGLRGLYGYVQYLSNQLFVATAEKTYLERHASLKGLYRKLPAVAGGGTMITVTAPATIPAGALLQRSDNVQYVTTAAVTIGAAGTGAMSIVATLGGSTGNAIAGTTLTLLNPIAGVTAIVVDANGVTDGTDTETDDELRARVLEVWQNPPQGGAQADYVEWATEVAGVTRAWCFKYWQGAGTVGVVCVMDDQTPTIIPGAATIALVQAQLDAKAPVTAVAYAVVPQPVVVPVQVHLSNDTADARAAVLANLADLFRQAGAPGTVLGRDQIAGAVQDAAGLSPSTLVSPTADTALANYQVAQLGAVTFA